MLLPRPEPSAGVFEYQAELARRLDGHPDTQKNYKLYLQSRRTADVSYLPIKLDIENVSRCNFACTMCAVSKWHKGVRGRDMTLDEFKRLIDEQYGLVEIKLNGIGEPLMQGQTFFDMVRYARLRHIWVRMTTNASLLHLRDNYRRLVDSGVNEIDISIDGADKQTFEGIRIQSDFDRVYENCKLLNGYLDEKGITRTKMWTLVQKANAAGLENHVPLAKELGFKHLVFSLQLHGWGDGELEGQNKERMTEIPISRLIRLVEMGKHLGVRVAFWDVAEKFDSNNLCPWPFERAVVTSDSRTVPCCMIGDPDKFELGKGEKFLTTWKSDEYRQFRLAHVEGRIPKVCKGCYK